jgi:hypothetical protein
VARWPTWINLTSDIVKLVHDRQWLFGAMISRVILSA